MSGIQPASLDWYSSLQPAVVLSDPDGPAAALGKDMARRWDSGDRPLVEEYLSSHPQLADDAEAIVELIYEEICQRQRHGDPINAEAFYARFPRWRERVRILLDCHRLLGSSSPARQPPSRIGETIANCKILAELGQGAEGRVYLATQPALGDRPVVLKVSPLQGQEHLSLARLQHTHIVPLYAVHDDTESGERVLCMPYFGSASLHKLLHELTAVPAPQRDGKLFLETLDRLQYAPFPGPARSPARDFLARASYPRAVAWLGGCLASGLHYAHERQLVHLDIKPANILVSADGQPMLLDFHLAQAPLAAGSTAPWLGGTLLYMAPEQSDAIESVRQRRKLALAVDERADIYSLGVLLYEMLGGALPAWASRSPAPCQFNPTVSPGLSDIVMKCLQHDPRQRYPDGAAVAADLRRYLADEPLVGVRNRSPRERWVKWRRRRPNGLLMAMLLVTAAVSLIGASLLLHDRLDQPRRQALEQLRSGREQLNAGHLEGAVEACERAIHLADNASSAEEIAAEAKHLRAVALQGLATRELGQLADRMRFLYPFEGQSPEALSELEAHSRAIWERRLFIREQLGVRPATAGQDRVNTDLLDLAISTAVLQARIGAGEGRATALAMLDEAESLFGPSAALARERSALGGPPGQAPPPRTGWDHYALGRALLRDGDLKAAAKQLEAATALEPESLWPVFYQGQCAYHDGRPRDAIVAFSVCIGRSPALAACPFNRALAIEASGESDAALMDYNRALTLDPTLSTAYFNRGLLHLRRKELSAAVSDLEAALRGGSDAVAVNYNLALAHREAGNRTAALDHISRALRLDPGHAQARELRDRLGSLPRP
jgi:eukaryotic-like serine/threonine-protein kinase